MPESKRFQNAARSLNQVNSWNKEQEEKEEKQKLLIQERKRIEHIEQSLKQNNFKHLPTTIPKPGLW